VAIPITVIGIATAEIVPIPIEGTLQPGEAVFG
ncbi:unnamed protein product, partial [marine sediment metagenome]